MAWVASVVLVREFVGGVSQTLAEVLRVTWVHKVLARVKKMAGFKFWGE